jgi:hypothetical protein
LCFAGDGVVCFLRSIASVASRFFCGAAPFFLARALLLGISISNIL